MGKEADDVSDPLAVSTRQSLRTPRCQIVFWHRPAEFEQLVPAEAEWFANLEEAMCVQYLCRSLGALMASPIRER